MDADKFKADEIRRQIKRQREIESIADIDYELYASGISESEFWKRWVG